MGLLGREERELIDVLGFLGKRLGVLGHPHVEVPLAQVEPVTNFVLLTREQLTLANGTLHDAAPH